MSRRNGFTLIELVVVILILGILAVTAAPKFINLQSDAKTATVQGFLGSIKSTVGMLHMKANIQGKTGADVTVDTDFGPYQFHNAYPETRSESTSPARYFVQTFIDLGGSPESESFPGGTHIAQYGDVYVYENNDISRIGYRLNDSDASLINGHCYAQYSHSASTQGFSLDVTGC
ncbi:type II secretion system GspH family protein [Shewanella submarina]|uniref:Type II secretion system protein n=1 Tax=Shewanella submarina TaxID=2016376 RepID=A0ABV7GFA6_9GAMM|nr:type II secretion system protein [Shewanella submarina]MCL1038692.1 type II secretion system GspH family protein [Shewanella submarina]